MFCSDRELGFLSTEMLLRQKHRKRNETRQGKPNFGPVFLLRLPKHKKELGERKQTLSRSFLIVFLSLHLSISNPLPCSSFSPSHFLFLSLSLSLFLFLFLSLSLFLFLFLSPPQLLPFNFPEPQQMQNERDQLQAGFKTGL